MNKNKGMIILSIILAVQFIIPLSVWGFETYKQHELDEKGQEVKLLVDWVSYDENRVEIGNYLLESITYGNEDKFVVFETKEDGFEIPAVTEAPESDIYVSVNRLKSWYNENWCFYYKSEVTKAQDKFDYYRLYDKENESDNIRNGKCDGPETEAYVVFKVYKNRFKAVNVYIDGKPVDTVIEEYNNNQFDVERYEYDMFDSFEDHYDEEIEEDITAAVTDVNGEHVSEFVAV